MCVCTWLYVKFASTLSYFTTTSHPFTGTEPPNRIDIVNPLRLAYMYWSCWIAIGLCTPLMPSEGWILPTHTIILSPFAHHSTPFITPNSVSFALSSLPCRATSLLFFVPFYFLVFQCPKDFSDLTHLYPLKNYFSSAHLFVGTFYLFHISKCLFNYIVT